MILFMMQKQQNKNRTEYVKAKHCHTRDVSFVMLFYIQFSGKTKRVRARQRIFVHTFLSAVLRLIEEALILDFIFETSKEI